MPTVADYMHGISVQEVDDSTPAIGALSPSVIGICGTASGADPALFPEGVPVLVRTPGEAAGLGTEAAGDTLQSAFAAIYAQGATPQIVVVRVSGATHADALTALKGDAVTQTGGIWELAGAAVSVGVQPRVFIAPDFSYDSEVITAMNILAENAAGIFYCDPDDAVTDTATKAMAFADAVASERGQVTWPHVKNDDDTLRPLSPVAAGVRALVDNSPGWWAAASNHAIRGVKRMNISLAFSLGKQDVVDDLNEKGVTTAVAIQGQYRLWGVRSASFALVDRLTPFLIVRRVVDNIGVSLQRGLLWAVDQGITLNLANTIVDASNAFLRSMRDLGAIVKGEAWIDEQLVTEIKQGKLYLDVKITPAYPLEHLTIRVRISDEGLIEIFG